MVAYLTMGLVGFRQCPTKLIGMMRVEDLAHILSIGLPHVLFHTLCALARDIIFIDCASGGYRAKWICKLNATMAIVFLSNALSAKPLLADSHPTLTSRELGNTSKIISKVSTTRFVYMPLVVLIVPFGNIVANCCDVLFRRAYLFDGSKSPTVPRWLSGAIITPSYVPRKSVGHSMCKSKFRIDIFTHFPSLFFRSSTTPYNRIFQAEVPHSLVRSFLSLALGVQHVRHRLNIPWPRCFPTPRFETWGFFFCLPSSRLPRSWANFEVEPGSIFDFARLTHAVFLARVLFGRSHSLYGFLHSTRSSPPIVRRVCVERQSAIDSYVALSLMVDSRTHISSGCMRDKKTRQKVVAGKTVGVCGGSMVYWTLAGGVGTGCGCIQVVRGLAFIVELMIYMHAFGPSCRPAFSPQMRS
ncbi:hypothetical protein AG1IA_00779 [Rhizoctonia solani AG-1 IA]|uniref:Uncharacterized protein n=1 Tax=Thanatephorus cucumeris (strain AG1-IA) TaxID=983506 RepID=L8X956_THACA|nr:hypothetical protein AG1IA_00779 [Rhizoctonia solani AG-1 IA]